LAILGGQDRRRVPRSSEALVWPHDPGDLSCPGAGKLHRIMLVGAKSTSW
jgi:hypothetical protein